MKITLNDLDKLGANREMGVLQFRKGLLEILDTYDKNVLRKRHEETEQQFVEASNWRQRLCDKDETALRNIPKNIIKYYRKDIEQVLGVSIDLL